MNQMDPQHLLPILKLNQISARSAELTWFHSTKAKREALDNLYYQVTVSISKSLNFDVAYEGQEKSCTVHDLIPSTLYTFSIKTGRKKEGEGDGSFIWSKDFVEIEARTSGMALLFKLFFGEKRT
jgi:hypothetical protein